MKPAPPAPTVGILVVILIFTGFGLIPVVGSLMDMFSSPSTVAAKVTAIHDTTSSVRGLNNNVDHRSQSWNDFKLDDGTTGTVADASGMFHHTHVGDTIAVYKQGDDWKMRAALSGSILGLVLGLILVGLMLWALSWWIRARTRPKKPAAKRAKVVQLTAEERAQRETLEADRRADLGE